MSSVEEDDGGGEVGASLEWWPPIRREDLSGVQRRDSWQGPLLGPAHRQRAGVVFEHLKRHKTWKLTATPPRSVLAAR